MWLPCRRGADFCLSACGTKEATLDAFGVPLGVGFFAKTSSASRRRNTRTPLAQSHRALQARKKVVRGAPVWFRLSTRTLFYGPEGLPKRGTVTERNVGGPPRAIKSSPRAKSLVKYNGLCAALQFRYKNCPREGPKHPGICEGFRVLGLSKKQNHS